MDWLHSEHLARLRTWQGMLLGELVDRLGAMLAELPQQNDDAPMPDASGAPRVLEQRRP